MAFNFLNSGWAIFYDFLKSLFGMFSTDISSLLLYTGTNFDSFVYSWSSSFNSYGVFIPVLFISVIGVSIGGCYGVFVFYDGVNALVGGN